MRQRTEQQEVHKCLKCGCAWGHNIRQLIDEVMSKYATFGTDAKAETLPIMDAVDITMVGSHSCPVCGAFNFVAPLPDYLSSSVPARKLVQDSSDAIAFVEGASIDIDAWNAPQVTKDELRRLREEHWSVKRYELEGQTVEQAITGILKSLHFVGANYAGTRNILRAFGLPPVSLADVGVIHFADAYIDAMAKRRGVSPSNEMLEEMKAGLGEYLDELPDVALRGDNESAPRMVAGFIPLELFLEMLKAPTLPSA